MPHYSELLTASGEIDRAAVRKIARNRARDERNIGICLALGWVAPRDMRLGDVPAWRSEAIERWATPEAIADANRRYRKTYARHLAEVRAWAEAMRADHKINRIADSFRQFVDTNDTIGRHLDAARAEVAEAIAVQAREHARWGEFMRPAAALLAAE
jgi:hypothetical protein